MSLRALVRSLVDLLRGLFAFPASRPAPGLSAAASIEARYARPRRCC